MKSFAYKARDQSGRLVTGIINVEDSNEVVDSLKERNCLAISVKELKAASSFLKSFGKRVTLSEINVFTRQLCVLLRAGIPLLACLSAIKEQTDNRAFKEVLDDVITQIKSGNSFSQALSKYESIFGGIYAGMIKTAEAGGTLDEVLERLAVFGEREEDIRAQIKSATTYPMVVISALGIAFFILVTFVIPKFAGVFSQFKTGLPLPTRILIWLNHSLVSFWYLIIIAGAVLIIAVRAFINTPKGRFFWDRFKIRIPVIGPLMLKMILSRFSRVLGMLTRTGVPIGRVLDLTKANVANCLVQKTIEGISDKVTQGGSLSLAMKESGFFPPLVIQMVSAGEGSGRLDELLVFVSDYYDLQIKYILKNLIAYIEPVLIFILGIAVLFIALAVFLPMWDMIHLFRH